MVYNKTTINQVNKTSVCSTNAVYLEKTVSVGEVTVGMAALVELLKQNRDAMPLGTFISLLEQASWELQHTKRNFIQYYVPTENGMAICCAREGVLAGF